jgi:hypothetical protein
VAWWGRGLGWIGIEGIQVKKGGKKIGILNKRIRVNNMKKVKDAVYLRCRIDNI